jgi:NADH-quinone oxidoreductase subunit F
VQARARGLLGDNVMGEGLRFDIELRRGAGAYICGEETALFNSIEGLRGEPRNKPPFPVQAGLFGKPTVVNNVETLVNVLDIVMHGGPAFARIGTRLDGHQAVLPLRLRGPAGVYEAPFGITLRELIDLAGGVRGGRPLQAVLLGGAAGVFVTPDELDMPLTFEGARAAGATLGSGVVMLFDDTVDLARSSSASPPSSATSRAASACPAGSAPCARRRRCTGWPRPARRPASRLSSG